MKKLRILSIIFTVVILFTIPANVLAADTETLPNPGITPDNPFYFADNWGKQISMFFTFGAENKVIKALQHAEERLAEMEAMAVRNKVRDMEKAARQYRNCLDIVTLNMGKAMVKGIDTSEQVTTMMSQHILHMYQQGNTVNEDCQQIKEQTRNVAENCQEIAIQTLARQDPEKALRLNIGLMEQECTRLNNRAGQVDNGQIEEALQQYERLQAMNHEILAYAEQLGKGPEAQQMMEQADANFEGVLAQVRNQLQIRNESSTDSPVQNRVEEQERLRLDSSNQAITTPNPEQSGYGSDSSQTSDSGSSSSDVNENSSGTFGVDGESNQNQYAGRGQG